jgi:hypothetical protein
MASNSALSAACSNGRAPCQTSATVTGEQRSGMALRLRSFQRAKMTSSRPSDTSIRMSESIRTDLKRHVSASAFLFATGEHKRWNPANLPGPSRFQPQPSWLVVGWPGTFHIYHQPLGELVRKWRRRIVARERGESSKYFRSGRVAFVS